MKKLIYWLSVLIALLNGVSAHAAPPAAPQNIQQAWLGTESLLLWDDVPGATNYNIYRADNTNTTWTLVGSSSMPRFRDPTYLFLPSFYVVTGVNGEGEGSGSEPSTVMSAEQFMISVSEPDRWNGTLSPTNAIIGLATSAVDGGQGLVDWGLDSTNFTGFLLNTNYLTYHAFELTNLEPRTIYFYRVTSITSNRAGVNYLGYFSTPDTNHPPVAEPFTAWGPAPTNGGLILLRGYDSNTPPQSLTFRVVSGPTNGTVSEIQPGWEWTAAWINYTPTPGARGYDHFQFVVNNGTWDSAPAMVTLTNWFNSLPAITNGALTAIEDTATPFSIPAVDPEGDELTFQFYSMNGTISGTPPDLFFTPQTNFSGSTWLWYYVSDGFAFSQGTFTVEVTPVNDAPEIMTNWMGSTVFSTWEDQPKSIWLFIYDPDPIGPNEIITVSAPAHGTIGGDQWNFIYTPASNFFGTDQFTVAARELDGTTGAPVTFTIEVQSMNDAPIAFDQTVTAFEDTPLVITPTAFDLEGDALTFWVAQLPSHGWVESTGTNFIYHPMTNFIGQDAFSFTASDWLGWWTWEPGWITVNVVDANDAPIADWAPYHLHTDIIVARPFNVSDLDGDAMVCEIVQPPLQGTVTVSGTNFTYTPEPGMSYYDVSFTYRATDGLLYSGEAPVTLWIEGTNSTPVAQDQSVTVRAEETVLFQLFVQDNDLIESPTGIIETAPAHGLVAFTNYSGAIYTPTNGFTGTDLFTYRPYDGFATGNLATVTITVLSPNLPPVASNSSVTGNEDTAFAINFVASDPNGDALTYELITTPTNGVLVGVGASRSYTPVANFNGGDSIRFRVFDGQYYSDVAMISITVAAVNDAPVATNMTVLDYEDTPVTILLGGTDIDNSITSCTFSIVTPPAHGTVSSGNRVRTYTPALNYNGPDSFTFQISDGSAVSSIATVSINVQPLNDPPSAPFQVITNYEDTTFPITLTGSDVDGDPITFSIMAQPYYGTLSGTPPNLVYKPNTNWNSGSPISVADFILFRVSDGTLVRSNTITIILLPVNDAPVANSQTRTMTEDASLNITLTGSDVETNALTFAVVNGPTNGTITGTGSNRVYTPNPNFFGTDTFTFVASDGMTNSAPATVSITVNPVQDAPAANAQSVITVEDTVLNITLSGSDPDGDVLSYSIISGPLHGALTGTVPNLVYTPAPNYYGSDSFVFAVADGTTNVTATVNITVSPVSDLSTPQGLRRRIYQDGIVRLWWEPVTGAVSYSLYRASETNGPFTLLVSNITTTNVDDATAEFQHTYWYQLRASDGIVDGEPSNTVLARPDSTGVITLFMNEWVIHSTTAIVQFVSNLADGTEGIFEYGTNQSYGTLLENTNILPFQRFYLSNLAPATVYYFRITATDANGNAVTSTNLYQDWFVTETWPLANSQSVSGAEDTALNITLVGSDPNQTFHPITYSLVSGVAHGTLTSTGINTYRYQPATNYNGADSFTFKVNNGELDSAPATVSINVTAVNDAPVVANVSFTTPEDAPATAAASFSDVDGGTPTAQIVTQPVHGAAAVSGTNLLYWPATNYNGADSFTYRISDGMASGNTATAAVTVISVEDLPIAFALSTSTAEDTSKSITVGGIDGDGDPISFSLVTPPAHGTLVGTLPSVTYNPAANYNGPDSFVFHVHDGKAFSAPATVSITVTPVNDRPVANGQGVSTAEDTAKAITLTGSDIEGSPLTYIIVSNPTHGSLSGSGASRTYTPATNYNGADSFTFQVSDASTNSALATVNITVTPVNDLPVASNIVVIIAEDTAVMIPAQFYDADGEFVAIEPPVQLVTLAAHGTAWASGANLFYSPATNYHGPDSFTYHVTDGNGFGNTATVSITVTPVNDAPIANPQTLSFDEDASLNIVLTGSDVDGDALTFIVTAVPTHGTLTGTAPNLTYSPDANYNGPDGFSFKVNDGQVDGNAASVAITVRAVDDAPVATNLVVTTAEDTTVTIAPAGSDLDGDAVGFILVDPLPLHGSVTYDGTNFIYSPTANYVGSDVFSYAPTDGQLTGAVATVTLTVQPVNDAPVANSQSVTTSEDTAVNITLTGTDVENDPLTFIVVSNPTHGTLTGSGAQRTYTPSANYNGSDSFSIKANDGTADSAIVSVSISVTPVNDAPVAQGNSFTLQEDGVLLSGLTGSDLDGDALTYRITTPPSHGTLTISGSSSNGFTYRGFTNYNGTDSFEFVANDGQLDSAPATISLTITPVNDMPGVTNQTVSVAEDSSVTFAPLAGDVDGDALTFTIFTAPTHGTAVVNGGNLIYTPVANYNGPDSFEYQAHDANGGVNTATVSVTIQPANDAPTANGQSRSVAEDGSVVINLTGSDLDGDTLSYQIVSGPTNGTLTGSAPNVTYTPSANYNGADGFTFRVNDGTVVSAAATVSITVTPVNDAPVANAQSRSVTEDGSVAITLTGSDVEGSTLGYFIVAAPTHGTLSGTAPNITYIPAANFFGPDSFSFKVNDGTADSAAATVNLTVTPVNDAPVANAQSKATAEDTATSITLTATDVDGDALTYTVVTTPGHGTLSGTAPNLTYTPAANYFGSDSFTFRVNDGVVNGNTATVSITVNSVNDAPVANPQAVTTIYNTAKAITLTGSDLEGSALTYSIVTTPTNGTLSGTAPNVTYTPTVGSAGADRFTFRVNDGGSNSAEAMISITTQNPVGIPPAPSSLAVTVPTATGTLILNWSCTATNEDGFKIERSLSSGSGWSQIATTGINILTFTNTGLTSNTRYYYRVRSYNRLGDSAYSNTVNAKPH